MKKLAVTFVELLVAMMLISALAIISINALPIFIKEDSDLLKFKSVLGTVSEVIYRLNNDTTMYPTRVGFADMTTGQYEYDAPDGPKYGGKEKFRKLFKTKFNVLKDDIKFSSNDIGKVPAYGEPVTPPDHDNPYKDNVHAVNFNELHCFTENKGITFCLPDTDTTNLASIYIRAYLSEIDTNNPKTFSNEKAIYFKVRRNGKVLVPSKVMAGEDYIINCEASQYNNYAHCRVRERATDMDIYETREDRERIKRESKKSAAKKDKLN